MTKNHEMMFIAKTLPFFLTALLSSCGFLTGSDPAEALAYKIESNAKEMRAKGINSQEFEFMPNTNKMKATSSDESPTALLEFVYYEDKGGTVMCFNKWYCTTYQNRFVSITRSTSMAKRPGETFVIRLTKVKDDINLSEIR